MLYQGNTTVVSRYLEPGEELLWAGQPPRGFLYRSADLVIAPIGGILLLFALSLEVKGMSAADGPIGLLYALPLTLFAAYLALGRFLMDLRLRGRTFYGITDSRIIIITGMNGSVFKSVDVRNMGQISIDDTGNGWGSVTFEGTTGRLDWLGTIFPGVTKGLVFEEVPRLTDVTKALQKAQAAVAA